MEQGWKLDFKKFRRYLKEKYSVRKAYIFIGFLQEYQDLYKSLQEFGYVLIFKPALRYGDGRIKGNCDTELVLQTMVDYDDYDGAVIVTGDGDFYCLVNYLRDEGKLKKVLIPNKNGYSALLKRINKSGHKYFAFMNDLENKLEYKKRASRRRNP
ncbi:MAG: hypothetical protein ACD_63C00057G0002 [uncultured bacterium]|nr:MAG: hypothetical protein ACD_63C00057G0002 [uncultured bacterium]